MINKKPFFIAEIGINHNGSLSLAKKLIDSAKNVELMLLNFNHLPMTG